MPSDNITRVDKLDRQDFIKFVENLIMNSDNYKRDNDSNSYVMALNSAWGTGKSYFLDLFIQDIKENEKINVVKYNAWENDYCDNAFNPLMYDILTADCLEFSTKTDADVEAAKKFLENIFDIGKSFAKKAAFDFIESKTGTNLEEVLNKVKKNIDIKKFLIGELPNLSELNEQREAFGNLKKYLSNASAWMKEKDSKLVVIIDELDRCKPTFAIQTLEIVKHIFDIENIVFLFAVDIEQLSHSISSVYGQGFDSVGYLCRFFDYIAKMPNPNIKNYIENEISQINAVSNVFYSYKELDERSSTQDEIIEIFELLYTDFNLSLRELDTIIKNYRVMCDSFLAEYRFSEAHAMYLFFVTLKYKNPLLFNDIFVHKLDYSALEEKVRQLRNLEIASIPSISEALIKFTGAKKLSEIDTWHLCNTNSKIYPGSTFKLTVVGRVDDTTNYSNILFERDMKKWEIIKNYTLSEYIHKQLENYNFTYEGTGEAI